MNPSLVSTPKNNLPRSTFDMSHDRKYTTQIGRLTPCFQMEVVPGDKISIDPALVVKFAPMVFPIQHELTAHIHFFYVPYMQLWDNWPDFINYLEAPDDVVEPTHPYITLGNSSPQRSTLYDYLGIPTDTDALANGTKEVNPWWPSAYQKIYNDYYRDENLVTPVSYKLQDGDNSGNESALFKLRQRAYGPGYFSSCLPFVQKGPQATVPLGSTADVMRYANTVNGVQAFYTGSDNVINQQNLGSWNTDASGFISESGNSTMSLDPNGSLYADLTNATASSINDLRRAFALQHYLENNARAGNRHNEWLKARFGVISDDLTLSRPEFLGGVSIPIQISEVVQNIPAQVGTQSPAGTFVGHGVGVGQGNTIGAYCKYFGVIMGIMSVRPLQSYYQGIHKSWRRLEVFDYYIPEFEGIGEEEVYLSELYSRPADNWDDIFGYLPRFESYKNLPSSIHGDYRVGMDFAHLARKFGSTPALNQDFIEVDSTEFNRIFAVQQTGGGTNPGSPVDNLWCHQLNIVKANRQMSIFSLPKVL